MQVFHVSSRLNSCANNNDNGRSFRLRGQYVLDIHSIRTITLDLDDTLWAIGPVIARAERLLRDWLGCNYPRVPERFSPDEVLALRRQVVVEYEDRAHDLTFLRREIIRRMGEAAGYAIDVDAAFEVFNAARNELELFADVRPALTSLGERFTLIAVTNGNADLERIGIADLFDGYVSARSAGAAKPSPRIFSAAVEAGGASHAQTLHVGDHPHLDVDAARAVGMRSVWINRVDDAWPGDIVEPDGVIGDLHELDLLLQSE
jgi:putative hydrolase of the HAD superfamily